MKVFSLFLSLLISTSVYAYPTRYECKARCYSIQQQSGTVKIIRFDDAQGAGSYSLQNTRDLMVEDCKSKAKSQGYLQASVYRDVRVTHFDVQVTHHSSVVRSSSQTKRGALGIRERSKSAYQSIQVGTSIRAQADIEYIDFDWTEDCTTDALFPQSDVPSTQHPYLGG